MKVKEALMEYENQLMIFDGLRNLISINKGLIAKTTLKKLKELRDEIVFQRFINSEFIHKIDFIIGDELENLHDSLSSAHNENDTDKALELILEIHGEVLRINLEIKNLNKKSSKVYNSEDFYSKQIAELIKQKEKLNKELQNQKKVAGKSVEEVEQHKDILKEKETSILDAQNQIKQYQLELEKKKKNDNIITEWEGKIKSTFLYLDNCISPIKDEHKRLNKMFKVYSFFSVLAVVSIISLEIIIFLKVQENTAFPNWKNYLAAIIPIPVVGGLLWAFTVQLNRTQRQLVLLAKHIHEIKYIEGLLLSINSLSLDINDSTKRVNLAIDRLLENHLSSGPQRINEEEIIKEENKDSVPMDAVLKILKEAKGLIEIKK